jgi:phosphoribosylaminoimidazole-succinocarboxamide synthase
MTRPPYHADMISEFPLVHQGKVRDSFAVGDDLLLIVASDRLSAFDVVLPDPIPGKGAILTQLSEFWFDLTGKIVANHRSGVKLSDVIEDSEALAALEGRAVVVRRLKPLPLEAIVRGYIIGSGWKDYQRTGSVCGIPLPPGLEQAAKLPDVIFTPSSKAEAGAHDENIEFEAIVDLVGRDLAQQVKNAGTAVYTHAAEHARSRGVIIADTKFEFGLDEEGKLRLMDEVLTPDSSRFWPASEYRTGISPPSFDKQFVRDYLETLDWDKKPPGPKLPPGIIEATAERYREASRVLTER